MQREYRLKRRNDFRRVFQAGKSFANRQFVVIAYERASSGPPRIGISVSKKIGNAVVRNRCKRLIKEITRHWISSLRPGTDYVIIARTPVVQMDYKQIKSSLYHVFHKGKFFVSRPSHSSQ